MYTTHTHLRIRVSISNDRSIAIGSPQRTRKNAVSPVASLSSEDRLAKISRIRLSRYQMYLREPPIRIFKRNA